MKAVVLAERGGEPVVADFSAPRPSHGTPVVSVLAAGMNPLDVVIAGGGFPRRVPEPPAVLGFEGVGELDDGRRVYFTEAPAPYGSFAERAPVDEASLMPVPDGLDPATATALGVSGTAAWTALEYRAHLAAGETVLILGAGGVVGQIATQAARLLGAGRVVAAARGELTLDTRHARGADAVVRLDRPQTLEEALRAAAPGGYDVIIDMIWGEAIPPVINAANPGARLVQVGNAASATVPVLAPAFRNRVMSLLGHTIFLTPLDVRRAAYEQLTTLARARKLTIDIERIPLDDFEHGWNLLTTGTTHRKLVVVPTES
ncbi:zinc-binding alcohol dehydrogenase family protein [Streptomyces sp. NPDC051569]|uniref:zinc-binding alcohol dehydrogenase family protein n=1 Tax=Streptomyces sp. NPDC051569 TaxID=3365661 RepID=UPI00378DE6C2